MKMKERNRGIFSLVYQLNEADNQIKTKEYIYLNDLANALNLTKSEVESIAANPKAYNLIPPPEEQERMQILYYIIFAMRIDGEINSKEENLAYKIGLKLGFHQVMLTDMINLMKNHLSTRLPNDALLKIVKKYLN
jgi:uncharacterized membrane protein YebE (DUF533 family)